jgi:hypothetical protein
VSRPRQHRSEVAGQRSFGRGQVTASQVPQRRTDLPRQARDDVVALEVGNRQALELPKQAHVRGRLGRLCLARQRLEMNYSRRALRRLFLVVVAGHRGVIDRARCRLERTLRSKSRQRPTYGDTGSEVG